LDVLVFCDRNLSQFNERTIPLALPRFGEPEVLTTVCTYFAIAPLLPPLGSDRVDKTVKKENRTGAGRA
jgi:hypothetical protein